jgi:NADPH2:quinone reductase
VLAFARTSGGGYAERAAVDDKWIFDLPPNASYSEGASLLTTYLTAWIPFMRQARLHPGSNVLVTAAAGGVGTAAIQLAVFLGATVTAAAGSAEKLALARELGATRTVSYEEIDELDDVDVVLDPVGGSVFTACLQALRPLGVAIAIGFAGGAWEPVDPARLVGRNVGVQGFYLGRLLGFRPDLVREEAEELLALWRRGAIRPVVGAEFPLDQANEALDLIGSRRSTGKVVLVP